MEAKAFLEMCNKTGHSFWQNATKKLLCDLKKKKEKKEDLCFVGFSFVSKPRYLQILFWILELTKNNWYCNIKPWCQQRWNNVLNAQPFLRMRFCSAWLCSRKIVRVVISLSPAIMSILKIFKINHIHMFHSYKCLYCF